MYLNFAFVDLFTVALSTLVAGQGVGNRNENSDLQIDSRYLKESSAFVTSGLLQTKVTKETLCATVSDLQNYRKWAIENINEKPGGGKFIIQVNDLEAIHEQGMKLIYDIDLPWPFNLRNQSIELRAPSSGSIGSAAEGSAGVHLVLPESTFAVKKFEAALNCVPGPLYANLEFKFDMKLNPMLNLFFSEELYRKNVESRIRRVMHNLEKRLAQK